MKPVSPYVYRPQYELKEFSKDLIAAGERVQIRFTLGREAFSYYSMATDGWEADDGCYEILIGASSQDIRLKALLFIRSGKFCLERI